MRSVHGAAVVVSLLASVIIAASVSACGTSASASAASPGDSSSPRAVVTSFAAKSGAPGLVDGQGHAARLASISGLGIDAEGLLWTTAATTVATVTRDALVTTIAGSKAGKMGYRDGTGARVRFRLAVAVACDPQGNAYVLDVPNEVIRKVTPSGVVTTFAGKVGAAGYRNGTGGAARFRDPAGIACDAAGNLYVTDQPCLVRKVTSDGVVTTLAGNPKVQGYADGTGKGAQFDNPAGIACDAVGNLYVADAANAVIRKVTPDGTVTTIAGKPGVHKWRDGTRATARLDHPFSIACDPAGDLFVSDWTTTIRMVRPDGSIVTVAGKPYTRGSANGIGSAARFKEPIYGIACDSQGQVFVAAFGAIRKLVLN